jgi:SAM-dependent methyltransferase
MQQRGLTDWKSSEFQTHIAADDGVWVDQHHQDGMSNLLNDYASGVNGFVVDLADISKDVKKGLADNMHYFARLTLLSQEGHKVLADHIQTVLREEQPSPALAVVGDFGGGDSCKIWVTDGQTDVAEALPAALSLQEGDAKMTMLDVGGGSAIYTIAAARANPNLSGVIFEKPGVVPITQGYIEDAGLASRIEVKGGDFFNEAFPVENADIVLFSNILHDWPDETNLKLIGKAFDCLQPGGRIVISELLIAEDIKSSSSAATSMNIIMIPWTQGRQYRAKELFRRLEDAGFINPQELHLVDDYSLVVGEKPPPS